MNSRVLRASLSAVILLLCTFLQSSCQGYVANTNQSWESQVQSFNIADEPPAAAGYSEIELKYGQILKKYRNTKESGLTAQQEKKIQDELTARAKKLGSKELGTDLSLVPSLDGLLPTYIDLRFKDAAPFLRFKINYSEIGLPHTITSEFRTETKTIWEIDSVSIRPEVKAILELVDEALKPIAEDGELRADEKISPLRAALLTKAITKIVYGNKDAYKGILLSLQGKTAALIPTPNKLTDALKSKTRQEKDELQKHREALTKRVEFFTAQAKLKAILGGFIAALIIILVFMMAAMLACCVTCPPAAFLILTVIWGIGEMLSQLVPALFS